ncbi:DUF806 family protein [Lactiplantibacillus plantarum]|uniref:DUF806 family protein n=1 Tax=Lactiplantibacillus plantarum TaxID=1590 RepID=UPI0002B3F39F|nr:DUF806 family protein [Lactiplantibacillus plantarum]AGE39588.1 Hypothetical protein zj316_2049 [Lactiplantibacillus plantarum ZJ316]ANI94718.1 hypothetical protein A9F05_03390 [Lactiplantibacillus plantarum]AYG28953.1 DUF806 family protein [Lactiplantibacillus plantarum]UZF04058.1 DUF806 family protein [Lactiplantibacillus plantarum]WJM30624.1 DUF806 family protein [Lactiplantibacillus plantarum]
MTPVAFIKGIIVANINEIPELAVEHIHSFFIPINDTSTDEPIVVISGLPERSQDYGNGIPFQSTKQVQIQFYYPKDYSGDMDAIESGLKQVLLTNDIRCYSDAGQTLTPDSESITNTLKFNYIKEAI